MANTKTIVEDKKVIRGWCMYDWANSVYSLSIATAIFPIYYNNITSQGGTTVMFMGMQMKNTALYSYAISFAFLFIALVSPLLSGIADFKNNKKFFMKMFCITGSLSCMMLAFFNDKSTLWIGIVFFVLSTIGYAGSIVFYNAFLPEICNRENQDKVSARGFSLGYIGSTILLIVNLAIIMLNDSYHFVGGSIPARLSFVMVGLWWLIFGYYSFSRLPGSSAGFKIESSALFHGYRELAKVFRELKGLNYLKVFLFSFFLYNMAVQTVMYIASLFGKAEIKDDNGVPMNDSLLIVTILIIQLVGIVGATLFSRLSANIGNIRTLLINLVVWVLVCVLAYYTYKPFSFIALAFLVGMVMGGVQALSRSTYSKMLPHQNDNASYFSFYDVCDRLGTVLGTLIYGLLDQITGSMRMSIFAIALFFVIGIIGLLRLDKITSRAKIILH